MAKPKTIDDLVGAPRNPRKITNEAADGLSESVQRWGDISGIVYNVRTGRLVCGHQRVAQLRRLGAQLVKGALQLANGERFPVRLVDWTEAEENAANITANNPHIAGTFTDELDPLLSEARASLGGDQFSDLRLDLLLDSVQDDLSRGSGESKYTDSVEAPTYTPKGRCPQLNVLIDRSRSVGLVEEIERSAVPEDVKSFLRHAAQRHNVFDYEQIAEYYAHAPPDVQSLMESSALVIIDFDRAIELGFVKLTGALAEAYSEDYPHDE